MKQDDALEMFVRFNSGGKGTGQAMALGVIIFLILIVFTIFYFWLNRKIEDRY